MMQDDSIRIRSTSKASAVGQDILLRENVNTRLLFRPELVTNPHNLKASVRGNFVFQKKKTSGQWEDYKTFDLSKLKDKEWVKLEIKAGELYELISKLDQYYQIYERYGIKVGETDFVVTPHNTKDILLSILSNPQNLDRLQELDLDKSTNLSVISNVNSLRKIFQTWENNKTNDNENFWQDFFKLNSWVIAQVFSYPVVLFKDKAYVGGKTLDNKEGNIIDFIYKNRFTENVLLIEIKTPTAPLLSGAYRTGVFGWNSEVSGAISQLLNYKLEIQENSKNLVSETQHFFVFDPHCMLIVGNAEKELGSNDRKKSFSLLRNDSKNISVVTYDELFEKINLLISLLEK